MCPPLPHHHSRAVHSEYPVRWIDDDASARAAVAEAQASPVYALDTEFDSGYRYYPRLCLIQLAWPGQVVLLDPFTVSPEVLAPLFESSSLAVLHAAVVDLDLLASAGRPRRLFDTQVAAQLVGLPTPSLATLALRHGLALDKSSQRSDWTRRPISERMRDYAAADVAFLPEICDRLDVELHRLGRRHWLDEESARTLATPPAVRDPELAWWKIPAAREMRPSAHLVVQRLAAERERLAKELDRPAPHVLSDAALIALTRARLRARPLPTDPTSTRLLESLRAPVVPGELRELPAPLTSSQTRAVDALMPVVADLAERLSIDRALLATRSDLSLFVSGRPSRLDAGWRAEVLDGVLAARPAAAVGEEAPVSSLD